MEILRQAGGVHIQAGTGVRPTICNTKRGDHLGKKLIFIYFFIYKKILAIPSECRVSSARDGTHAIPVTRDSRDKPKPYPTEPQGNSTTLLFKNVIKQAVFMLFNDKIGEKTKGTEVT